MNQKYMDDREPSATAAPYSVWRQWWWWWWPKGRQYYFARLDSKSAPFPNSREALEERGQQLEDLNRQTSKLESAGETFAGLAKQLKETTKQNVLHVYCYLSAYPQRNISDDKYNAKADLQTY